MALKAANMENCDKKKRCLFGSNEGLAYTPGDECESGYEFNSQTCDCEPLCYAGGSYRVDWEFTFDYTARLDCGTSTNCTVDCDNNPRIFCGTETIPGSFNYGGGGCLISTNLPDSFDACGEPISAAVVVFYNCSEPVDDPALPGNFQFCGSPIYSYSRPGCTPGATDASVSFEVVDLNA